MFLRGGLGFASGGGEHQKVEHLDVLSSSFRSTTASSRCGFPYSPVPIAVLVGGASCMVQHLTHNPEGTHTRNTQGYALASASSSVPRALVLQYQSNMESCVAFSLSVSERVPVFFVSDDV